MSETKKVRINFYFDFLSPYSYLGFKLLEKKGYFDRLDCEWNFKPVVLGSVISHYETKGPSEITPKRNYLFKDLNRKTAKENIAFKRPDKLPFNSLLALRLALKEASGDQQLKMISTLFDLSWGSGGDLSSLETLEENLTTHFGSDKARMMMELEGSKDARRALKNNMNEALEIGVFGVPSFYASREGLESELFWGADSIEFLEQYLAGDAGYNKQVVSEFEQGFPFL